MAALTLTCILSQDRLFGADIEIPRGESLTVTLVIQSAPGVAHDGTGTNVCWSMRFRSSSQAVTRSIPGNTTGVYVFTLTAAETLAMQEGRWTGIGAIATSSDRLDITSPCAVLVRAATSGVGVVVVTDAVAVNEASIEQTIDIDGVIDLPGNTLPIPAVDPHRCYYALPILLSVTVAQLQGAGAQPGAICRAYVTSGGALVGSSSGEQIDEGMFRAVIGPDIQANVDPDASISVELVVIDEDGIALASHQPVSIQLIDLGIPANEPPIVSITSPTANAVLAAGLQTIAFDASDNASLNAANFAALIDGAVDSDAVISLTSGSGTTAVQGTATVDAPSGATALGIRCTDAGQSVTNASVAVSVQGLAIATPAAGTVDEGPVHVAVLATPSVPADTALQVLVDGSPSGSPGTVGAGATTASLTAGSRSLTAQMVVGGATVTSAPVVLTVQDQVPTVAVSSPIPGQHVAVGQLPVLLDVTHPSATPGQLTVQVSLDDETFASPVTATYVSGIQWQASVNIATQATHTVYARAYDATPGGTVVPATPVVVSSIPQYVEFDLAAAAQFEPRVELIAGSTATVTWTVVETATETTGLTPTIALGGVARTVRMTVTDGVADARDEVRMLNLGFDAASDAGLQNIGAGYNHAAQPVTGVRYLSGLTSMEWFMAGSNGLTKHQLAGTLDLTGCTLLRHVECFNAAVQTVVLPAIAAGGTPSAQRLRLCFEANSLTEIDLNPVRAVLYDLRAAVQSGGALHFTALSGPLAQDYHFCVRDQTVTGIPTWAQLPAIEEFWAWNTGQTGALAPVSTAARSVQAYTNSWSSVGLSGAPNLVDVDLRGCSLSTTTVDAILAELAGRSTTNGTLDLRTNGGPTATGMANVAVLQGRGWTVQTEAQVGEGVLYDDFNRADGPVGNGWTGSLGATGVIASNMLQRTDTGDYRVYTNPAGGALPADYTVYAVVPHATVQTGFWGLVGRWDGANGVRLLSEAPTGTTFANLRLGQAIGFGTGNVTITADNAFPSSWTVDQPHTIAMAMTGTLIEIYIDGVLVGHGTVTTNATATGTSYGCCGEGNNRLWDYLGTVAPA